jgi:hypothetical protein
MKGNIMITFDYTDNNVVVDNTSTDDNKLFTKVKFGSKTFIKINIKMFKDKVDNYLLNCSMLSSDDYKVGIDFYIDTSHITGIYKRHWYNDNTKIGYTVYVGKNELWFANTEEFENFIKLI